MSTPEIIRKLVERFDRNHEQYRAPSYNETQIRREFIDPFFTALGWDVDNKAGDAEAYKDVIHEASLKIGEETKAPDYCFRIGGTRKFFVEAKKPVVNIKQDAGPAFQLRRYAWSAKLPLSILTDFEEFAVYDCRIRPDKKDDASKGRIDYITFDKYVDKWDEIVALYSKDAVRRGDFDRHVESTQKKRGTSEVDDVFLSEIEEWRDVLARNIALRNHDLVARELNHAVQRTIDRIIFLRVCEDRGIEEYGLLRDLLDSKDELYPRLFRLFESSDDKYNSGLFHFKEEKGRNLPDAIARGLKVDDAKLRQIIRGLYYPDSPYEFSVLPADILGQVYERFLGKVIRLTKGHQAKVEEKPEVKKAGGVYYTPTYVVDYIVEHTVGKLLDGKTPKQTEKLKILDPACGSGSFLIVAYQYLLDWHLKYYTNHTPAKHKDKVFLVRAGEWRLTIAERKRILLNNIFGVDIDAQAVEVTKLSLLLKVLEGESRDIIESNLRLFRERALPDLANNIKCGNSLIGPDFYEVPELDLDDDEKYRINVFDWKIEFPEIMKSGGFDAVIGNPPYVQAKSGRLDDVEKEYFFKKYRCAEYQPNTYSLFVEVSIGLIRKQGKLGFIIPNYWLSTEYDKNMRHSVIGVGRIDEVVNLYAVFAEATVDTLILVCTNRKNARKGAKFFVRSLSRTLKSKRDRLDALKNRQWTIDKEVTVDSLDHDLRLSFSTTFELRSASRIADLMRVKKGMQPYELGKGVPPQTRKMMDERVYHSKSKSSAQHKKLITASDVARYRLTWHGDWIKYGNNLAAARDASIFKGNRVLIQRIVSGKRLSGIVIQDEYICNTDITTLQFKPEYQSDYDVRYILGILLSGPVAVYLRSKNVNLDRATFPKINVSTVADLPIRTIDFKDKADKSQHDKMVKLAQSMLDLNKKLLEAKSEDTRMRIEREIVATDRRIDKLVYELYGLTDEEIKIVEIST